MRTPAKAQGIISSGRLKRKFEKMKKEICYAAMADFPVSGILLLLMFFFSGLFLKIKKIVEHINKSFCFASFAGSF